MLAKLTAKNQLTLPKRAVEAVGAAQYFDVAVHQGQIVLTPVRIQRTDALRGKLAALGLGEGDVAAAVRWARRDATPSAVAESPTGYKVRRKAGATKPRKTTGRRA